MKSRQQRIILALAILGWLIAGYSIYNSRKSKEQTLEAPEAFVAIPELPRLENKKLGEIDIISSLTAIKGQPEAKTARPLEEYKKVVISTIEERWHEYQKRYGNDTAPGSLKLTFNVNERGTPSSLKIVERSASAIVTELSLKSILDADIPPMSIEVRDLLNGRGLDVTYDIIIY